MPLLASILAAASVLCVFWAVASRSTPADVLEARLSQFGDTGRAPSLAEVELTLPFTERVFRPIFDRMGNAMASRVSSASASVIQENLNLAGRPWGLTVNTYLALRVFSAGLMAFAGYALALLVGWVFPLNLLATIGGLAFGWAMPQGMVSRKIRARQKQILLSLPSALDLLTISVEAGLGFDAALQRVCDKYDNALSQEFNQVLNEIRLGRPRLEALEDLGKRARVEELNGFVQAVVQSEQLGVGIANVLRIQSEEIRRRRRQRAEEAGQKAPLKMLFPMVGCIFPTLFVVLLGPALLQITKQFAGK
jgi:tight adherence protein C